MKKIIKITTSLSLALLFNCSPTLEKKLVIKGKIFNTNTRSILLVKPNQDIRFDTLIEIPVENGRFQYKSKLQNPEAVKLFLGEAKENRGGRFMPLFLENEKMELAIYPEEEFDNNIVMGGKFNAQYEDYKNGLALKFDKKLRPLQDSLDMLGKNYNDINQSLLTLNAELEKAKNVTQKNTLQQMLNDLEIDSKNVMATGKSLESKLSNIYSEQSLFQKEYMKKNTTMLSYYFLLNDLIAYIPNKRIFYKEIIDIELAKSTSEKLAKEYPNHPYNVLASNLLRAIDNIKIGNDYVDFIAPDLDGNQFTLSEEINGKVSLLDLWATWCAPCIKKSRTMVPLYNEFKDKGFTIVGVAGEFKNTDRLVKFREKEKWPWLNLVELERKNSIWLKYGVGNSGGAIFLINEKGKILAMDPTAEEVRKVLEKRLN